MATTLKRRDAGKGAGNAQKVAKARLLQQRAARGAGAKRHLKTKAPAAGKALPSSTTAKNGASVSATPELQSADLSEREAMARSLFDPVAAAAARSAFLKRRQRGSNHGG